jgi:hypothetical protein
LAYCLAAHASVWPSGTGAGPAGRDSGTGNVTKAEALVEATGGFHSFQIEHVSVEVGLETRDNWDMNFVRLSLKLPAISH